MTELAHTPCDVGKLLALEVVPRPPAAVTSTTTSPRLTTTLLPSITASSSLVVAVICQPCQHCGAQGFTGGPVVPVGRQAGEDKIEKHCHPPPTHTPPHPHTLYLVGRRVSAMQVEASSLALKKGS